MALDYPAISHRFFFAAALLAIFLLPAAGKESKQIKPAPPISAGDPLSKLQKAVADNPQELENQWRLAKCLYSLKRYSEAIPVLSNCITIAPERIEFYTLRGQSELQLKKFLLALSDFSQIVAIAPSADAYVNRASALSCLGKNAEALKDYNSAVSINENFPAAYVGRALTLDKLGKKDMADKDRVKAKQLGF